MNVSNSHFSGTVCMVREYRYVDRPVSLGTNVKETNMSLHTSNSRALIVALITLTTAAGAGRVAAQSPATAKGDYRVDTFKKPSEGELKKKLTSTQFEVTQHDGTERPFNNEYWDNHEDGIYVDVISGEPLFSSKDKFESGTGWPSFTRPLVPENVTVKTDKSLFMTRTEVRSAHADSHLGHLFDDGPKPTGQRYCMNSASMRFIPVKNLAAEGYGNYLKQFDGKSHK